MSRIWPFSFNFFLFSGMALIAPNLVPFYQGLGFSGIQVGLLTGITPLVTLIAAPLWTSYGDRWNRHRLALSLALLGSILVVAVFPIIRAFGVILILAISLNFFLSPINSFADTATMVVLADRKDLYGRIRLGGTIGFGLAAFFGGLLFVDFGLRIAFWGCAAFFLVCLLICQKFTFGEGKAIPRVRGAIRLLLRDPGWLRFLTLAFAGGAALAAFNNFFFPLLAGLGASESLMGIALAIGSITEIPVFLFGSLLVRHFGAQRLLLGAVALTGVRLLLFAAASSASHILLAQLLNGLTFPLVWVAGVTYADEAAPLGMKATGQGLFSAAVFGLGSAAGGFLGGPLQEIAGSQGLYLVFGAAVLLVVAVVAKSQRSRKVLT
jgi:PPP family 3-phenylpropionic acid transporter